jgi:LmbE family N-acetylglucosaminyl deacetylase
MTHRRVVLHVSPHPDDEAIAAGMTLGALARSGWQVVNLLLSSGRPGDESRRRAEAESAARLSGYRLEIADPPTGSERNAAASPAASAAAVADALQRHRPALVISPQPNDAHPAHTAVGCGVRDLLAKLPDPPVWWMWGLWAELARPTLYLAFGDDDLSRALVVLTAYAGEVERNDFRRVLRGRALSNSVLGSERVFGFGSAAASDQPFAELLTEAVRRNGQWYAGRRRMVDFRSPLGDGAPSDERLDRWLSDRLR